MILSGTKIGNNCVVGVGSIFKENYKMGLVIIQSREK